MEPRAPVPEQMKRPNACQPIHAQAPRRALACPAVEDGRSRGGMTSCQGQEGRVRGVAGVAIPRGLGPSDQDLEGRGALLLKGS
jgi:hypothetical protein